MNMSFLLLSSWLLFVAPAFSDVVPVPDAPRTEHKAPPQLPNMPLTTTEGTQVNVQTLDGKVVLVLFQPDCDHCQREAEAIREHLNAFADYKIYFITYAPMEDIRQFARDYQLEKRDNIVFALSEVQPILDNFGSIPTPSLYIYSGQKQLVEAFEGETPIKDILEHL